MTASPPRRRRDAKGDAPGGRPAPEGDEKGGPAVLDLKVFRIGASQECEGHTPL